MRLTIQPQRRERGSALIEISMSYAALVIVALLTLKASVNATAMQAWTVKQSMTDAFITREAALASRIPFDEIAGGASLWTLSPGISTSTATIGKLPGGQPVTATVYRSRIPDANNLPSAGGTGTATTNPSGSETWSLQSILVYMVSDRQYMKSRTVLRVR